MVFWFFLKKFSVLLVVLWAQLLAYRGELFFWVLARSLPLVFLGLWVAGGPRPDLDYARYFFFAWLAGLFWPTGVAYELSYEVRTGRLSPLLLRPFSPAADHLAGQVAQLAVSLPLGLPVLGFFLALFPGIFANLEAGGLLVFGVYLVLSFAFHFALGWLVGALAFWLERADSLLEAYYALLVFFGGLALPLEALPPGLLRVLDWTPLPYTVYYPAAAAAGWREAPGFGVMLAWMLAVALLAALVWRRGLLRYSAMGA